jgi:hypothetical protein
MLNREQLISSVKPFYDVSPQVFVTTLRCGEHKAEFANVEELTIKFNKYGNEEYGKFYYSIYFGAYIQSSEMFNKLFYLSISQDMYELACKNLNTLDNTNLKTLIKDKFNLKLDYGSLMTYPQIHFELVDKNKNQHFDFVELAELIFKQLGLFET